MENKIICKGAKLHNGQLRIMQKVLHTDVMYHTIVCPRQWGKSFFAIQLLLYFALNNKDYKVMFCSPTYSQASKVYREMLKGIRGANLIESTNSTENSVVFINGSEIYFKSIQQPENLRGYSIDIMLCDEAGMYKESVFDSVLRPMLTVRGKKCFFLSTPKGKNWFYKFFILGNDISNTRYMSHKGIYADNPFANIEEIEDSKKVLPDAIYRQEYNAEFVDDGGEVFSKVLENSVVEKWEDPISGEVYYAGVDVGKQNDFTVCTLMNQNGRIKFILRINKNNWGFIASSVSIVLSKYKPRCTYVECNGLGDVFFDLLKKSYSNITPFITTNESKQNIIESLILDLQTGTIQLPIEKLFPELKNEMDNFTFVYSKKTRTIFYGAISGMHDDCVMSLDICNNARKEGKSKGIYTIL